MNRGIPWNEKTHLTAVVIWNQIKDLFVGDAVLPHVFCVTSMRPADHANVWVFDAEKGSGGGHLGIDDTGGGEKISHSTAPIWVGHPVRCPVFFRCPHKPFSKSKLVLFFPPFVLFFPPIVYGFHLQHDGISNPQGLAARGDVHGPAGDADGGHVLNAGQLKKDQVDDFEGQLQQPRACVGVLFHLVVVVHFSIQICPKQTW